MVDFDRYVACFSVVVFFLFIWVGFFFFTLFKLFNLLFALNDSGFFVKRCMNLISSD